VFINDDGSGLLQDYDAGLEKLAPHEPVSQYRHNDTGVDNADAHIKRQIMGREVVVAVTGGRLDLGTWEQITYGEFDGRRYITRRGVSSMGEARCSPYTQSVVLLTFVSHRNLPAVCAPRSSARETELPSG